MEEAVTSGNLDEVKRLFAAGTPLGRLANMAARNGHVETLKWIRAKDIAAAVAMSLPPPQHVVCVRRGEGMGDMGHRFPFELPPAVGDLVNPDEYADLAEMLNHEPFSWLCCSLLFLLSAFAGGVACMVGITMNHVGTDGSGDRVVMAGVITAVTEMLGALAVSKVTEGVKRNMHRDAVQRFNTTIRTRGSTTYCTLYSQGPFEWIDIALSQAQHDAVALEMPNPPNHRYQSME
jgi:hypothetical protein